MPPGFELPSYEDPTILIGPSAERKVTDRLRIVGFQSMVHRIDLDPSPRGWASGLLNISIGSADPWHPLASYSMVWEPASESGPALSVILDGRLWRFPALPAGGGDASREAGSVPSGATLAWTERGAAVTRQMRRYHFIPVESQDEKHSRWRLEAIDWLDQPGRTTRLIYDDTGRPTSIVFPNKAKAVFHYGRGQAGLVEAITLPLHRSVKIKRDAQGYISAIEQFRGDTGPQAVGGVSYYRYDYERDASGGLMAVSDDQHGRRGIERLTGETGRHGPPPHTVLIRRDRDGSFQFQHFFYRRADKKNEQAGGWRRVSGYGEPGWTLEESIQAYRHAESPVRRRVRVDPSVQATNLSPRVWLWAGRVRSGGIEYAWFEEDGGDTAVVGRWAIRHFGEQATAELDEQGRVVAVKTDAEAKPIIRYLYNASGDLVEVKTEGREGGRFLLEHDAWGRLIAMTYPDQSQRRWAYDEAGGLVRILHHPPPPHGASLAGANRQTEGEHPPGTMAEQIHRDPLGRIVEIDAPEGVRRRFTYDRAGRLSAVTELPGGRWQLRYDRMQRLSQRQDARGNRESFQYHASGRVARHVFDPPGREREVREYDLRGRLIAETTTALGRIAYEYDEKDRVVRIVHPDGTDTIQRYDKLNRVVAIRGSHQPPVDVTYDELGRPTAVPALGNTPGSARVTTSNRSVVPGSPDVEETVQPYRKEY